MSLIDTLIIGAGPAGLAVAAHLRKRGIQFHIVERSQRAGNAWFEHYDRLHLHTVKELSHLPFLPFPEDYPRYVPKHLVADYLKKYAKTFEIHPEFETEVEQLQRAGDHWKVHTKDKVYQAKKVVVATGVNRIPFEPHFPGEENFEGEKAQEAVKRASMIKELMFFKVSEENKKG